MLRISSTYRHLCNRHQHWTWFTKAYFSSSVDSGVPYEQALKLQKESVSAPVTVPAEADVVIIGGGSIGCNTLYHLTKLGVTNAVLLEKDRITAGTTWHTAGLIWSLRPTDTDILIQAHTRHLLGNVLLEETGVDPGWIKNGGLFVASTKERLQEYERMFSLGKVFGIDSQVLSPSESKKLYPLMNVDDVYGCLFSPSDGILDPTGFCTALTRASTRAGAKLIEKCPVSGIQVHEDDLGVRRVTGVETPYGTIKTKCVAACTGAWSPQIGKMAGVSVPIFAMRHAYVVTNRIEGIQNMPNIRDHDSDIYLKLQGDALCIGGYESNPIFLDSVPNDFGFSLFDLDWDVFGVHLESAMNRIPVLEKTGIKSTVCGPESFTPDHKPVMGEDPFVRGFYHGYGFNSGGMMLGGGSGRELARWIVNGRPELDMYGYDIRRFNRQLIDNKTWIKERGHESYSKHYTISYTHDEPLAGRNYLKDPFHEELLNYGCIFEERHGWERSGWFSPDGPAPVLKYDYYGNYGVPAHENYIYRDRLEVDYSFDFPSHHDVIRKECLACRQHVAIFNMSYFGKYYLIGPDAQKAADWIFTNDVSKAEGATIYTCMLNKRGCVEADLTVSPIAHGEGTACDPEFEGDRGFYVAAGGGSSFQNWAHLSSVIQDRGFNAQLVDRSTDMGMLSVQGPKSRELLQSLTDADLSDGAFPFSTHQVIKCGGHKVRAMRLSFVGEMGWELHIPKESCVPVYRLLMEKGKKFNVANAGYRAIDSLSVEKGYRHWHADLRLDDTPLEAGLGFTCKLKTPTPFLGRKALEQQQKDGLKKRLVCFSIDKQVLLWGMEAIFRNGQPVGFIRRAGYAFTLEKSLGYGYVCSPDGSVVTPDFLKSGSYELEKMGERIPATLHLRSPFDPKSKRVQGIYDESS